MRVSGKSSHFCLSNREERSIITGRGTAMTLGFWIAIGTAIGTAIGVANDHVAMGVAFGVAFGVAAGTFATRRKP